MDIETRHRKVKEFGCVLCQKWHREGEPLYQDHILFQSKHGIRERPDPNAFVPADSPEAYYPPWPPLP